MSSKIYSIKAREILDSRGNPTVETMVVLESGYRATAGVPSGASVGTYEAHELRDRDEKRFNGMGVLTAVNNVNSVIAPRLLGLDCHNQGLVDTTMIQLDGTPKKEKLGANAILSVSLAAAAASAAQLNLPLYAYLNTLFTSLYPTKIQKIPTPLFNMINGGKHGAGNLDFQEFHVIPATSKPYHTAIQIGAEVYRSVKNILVYRNAIHSVGDEGGFAPNLFTNADALEVLMEAVRATPYHFGLDVFFGLDVAANHFKVDGGYHIKDKPAALSSKDFVAYLKTLHEKYRLLLLEDALGEDEWDLWVGLTADLGKEVLIVGDDLLVTNPDRLSRAIKDKACQALLAKPNQIGTLSEFFMVIATAKKNNFTCIVSHRSGETNDTLIADIGVAVQADYVKFGAPARGERVAKYNRLLQIENELFPTH